MTKRNAPYLFVALLASWLSGCNSSNNAVPFITTPTPSVTAAGSVAAGAKVSVLEHHNGPTRAGVYIDPALTKASVPAFHVDQSFKAAVSGRVYAQLLYVSGSGSGKDLVIAATEENNIYALDAATGTPVWSRNLGTPVPLTSLPCGNIDPLGVTGTPVIDPASQTLFADAMTTPDSGATKKHLIFALSLADGSVRAGWPVDVSAAVTFGSIGFDSSVQNQRGALAFVNGTVYVPYGGHFGDCGDFRGWLVGVPAGNPSAAKAWATGARGGGSWAPSGVASENGELFISTGNTFDAVEWSGGESLLRLGAGPVFSGRPADYFAPANWRELDAGDIDIGGTGPVILDVPGSKPSKLLLGLGKDGKMYLADRANLGGVGNAAVIAQVATDEIINSAAAYTTSRGSYVVFKGRGSSCPSGQSGNLTAVRIIPGSPPGVETAWCADQHGEGSPMVTTTDGNAEAIVWSAGAEGDNRLRGFDGDTGQVIYAGGGAGDVIGSVARYHSPIAARGRIFVGAEGTVKAFVR